MEAIFREKYQWSLKECIKLSLELENLGCSRTQTVSGDAGQILSIWPDGVVGWNIFISQPLQIVGNFNLMIGIWNSSPILYAYTAQ